MTTPEIVMICLFGALIYSLFCFGWYGFTDCHYGNEPDKKNFTDKKLYKLELNLYNKKRARLLLLLPFAPILLPLVGLFFGIRAFIYLVITLFYEAFWKPEPEQEIPHQGPYR